MTTSQKIELIRKQRIKDDETAIISILQKLNSSEIDLYDQEVWVSLRNGLLRGADLTDLNYLDYINVLIKEYNSGSPIAKKEILDLAKDPLRQNLSEEVQQEVAHLKGISLERLPQSGPNALRLYDGQIYKNSQLNISNKESATKALDFKVINTDKNIYTYNKYNKWVGGSTDDVYKDIVRLISEFNKITDKTFHLIIILDGNYWDTKRLLLSSSHPNDEFLTITSSDSLTTDLL